MNPISIWIGAWTPGTQVTVKIDSEFGDHIGEIEAGNALWNNPLLTACSGVTFIDFETKTIATEELDDTPPFHHLIWQVDDPGNGFNGGVFVEVGFGGWIEAARIKIKPNLSGQAGYFNYLGTHEVGHTFNLHDCLSQTGCPSWTDTTIMTGHADGITSPASFNTSGPKACDIEKVKAIYAHLLVPLRPNHQRQNGLGQLFRRNLNPVRTADGSGTSQTIPVIRTRRMLIVQVTVCLINQWTLVVVTTPLTIVNSRLAVLRGLLTVGQAVVVFQLQS